ncbi:RND superfamily putative drug exporter [Nocardioides luteus]|uniref:Membrane protein n=1 Tax=Nocardioides luteus TaxID=1844 RepID=A0ABQ5SQ49_9ACTN|nr:MMPL family transporter [Nocardioides luteus]MDR7313212.1 RND superfamily putative drug exporter [Nocardioides luteus]GGR43265.1 membrane protein [Nocardioides luteus]GLJ66277.1 membrane protein [Nocardioides luteus]
MTTQTISRPSPLRRLASFSQRHHWTALLLWVVVIVGVTATSQVVGDDYRNSFDIPGTQSQEMADLQAKHGGSAGDEVRAVIHDERGWDTDRAAVDALIANLGDLPHVEAVVPADPQRGSVSEDGTTALVTVVMDAEPGALPITAYEPFLDLANDATTDDLQVEMAGDSMREVNESEGGGSEGIGMLAALVIMLFMFGSFLAASLPLITAIFAVGTTFGVVTLLSHLTTIPDYTAPMLMIVGLGVGIDYALLVFSRYRSELLRGATREDATSTAIDTAGRSVLFAGVSVILALCGLYVLQLTSIQGVVLGVALTVLMTMIAAVTLLPSLLTLFGKRLEKSVRRHAARSRREPGQRWRAWAGGVQRHPWAALIVSVVALGALATPVLSLQLGFADAGNDDASSTTRKAYDLVSDKFGPGANGPLVVMTDGSQEQATAAYEALDGYAGVAAVTPPQPSEDGAVFTSIAFPATGPQDPKTTELVKDLRDDLGDDVLVGGSTAALIDYSDAVGEKLPLFIGLVVGLSALLLMCVFRSVAVAIKAAVLNVISIGASMGAMTYVFQEGLLGVEPGPIEAFLPVMTFAIVFGLSMDYEVFLISRMREEWLRRGDAQEAVREGLAHTGGVITAAAAIMVVVFGAFWFSPDRMLQEMGFVMAVAVLLDAVVVRCLVVPAVMRLLGASAWWLPTWLDRLLPRLQHVE